MNRATSKDLHTSSTSPSNGNSRLSSRSFANSSNTSNTLMNGNGELVFRRSPSLHHHHANPTTMPTGSYYTLGSPSISTSCNSEEISDINNSSLEEENISHLSHRFEQLQKQVEILTESQANQDERYKRTKQENDVLLNRIHTLEDQLREIEISSDTRAQEDEKRFRETMAKQIKLKSQECEQHLNTNCTLQQEIIALQKDLLKNEATIRQLRNEKETLEVELQEKNSELINLDDEIHKLRLLVKNLKDEENVKSNIISILNEELEEDHNRSQHQDYDPQHQNDKSLNRGVYNNNQSSSPKQSRRSSVTSGFGDEVVSNASNIIHPKALRDMEISMSNLRDENKHLKAVNEELQAQLFQAQLEEGRSLIQEGTKSYSLADEMGELDVQKLLEALKAEQEDNARLRHYIDGMLLKVVEINPELLDTTTNVSVANAEVRTNTTTES